MPDKKIFMPEQGQGSKPKNYQELLKFLKQRKTGPVEADQRWYRELVEDLKRIAKTKGSQGQKLPDVVDDFRDWSEADIKNFLTELGEEISD